MSHTTKISGVKIRNISALQAAVNELKNGGLNCSLVQNQAPRMYSSDQFRRAGYGDTADYVMKLPGKYDVGFCKETEGENKGCYTAVFDSYQNEVGKHIGANHADHPQGSMNGTEGDIGGLMQAYSKNLMIQTATAQGHTVSSCSMDALGQIHLTIS